MKLDEQRVEAALSQFEAQKIPDEHPATAQLSELFGDHTFFVDGNGLHIVEPAGETNSGRDKGKVVRLAIWSDENRTSLAPHPPEILDVEIEFDSAA
jgi:hypothetical protein